MVVYTTSKHISTRYDLHTNNEGHRIGYDICRAFVKKRSIAGMLEKTLATFWDISVVSSRNVTPLLYYCEPNGGLIYIKNSGLGKCIIVGKVYCIL